MEIKGFILGNNLNLIGFYVEGTEREFGGIGNGVGIQAVNMDRLLSLSKERNGVYEDKYFKVYRTNTGMTKVVEKNNRVKGIRNLACFVIDANGNINNVPNEIEIMAAACVNNARVGFQCRLFKSRVKYLLDKEIIRLTSYLEPVNFYLKERDGKKVFSGKAGCSISKLPRINVNRGATSAPASAGRSNYNQDSQNPEKESRNSFEASPGSVKVRDARPATAKRTYQNIGDKATVGVDILDILEFASAHKGYIINFSDTEYYKTGSSSSVVDKSFNEYGIGEISSPYLITNKTKFNASLMFKRPGYVSVVDPDTNRKVSGKDIDCYIIRTKNVFYNGRYHMDRLGVMVRQQDADELTRKFAKTLSVTSVNDKNVVDRAREVIRAEHPEMSVNEAGQYVLFAIEIHNLDFMSKKRYPTFIMDNVKLRNTVYALTVSELKSKLLRGKIKELDAKGFKPKSNKPIIGIFADLSDRARELIGASGIDIYSGNFTKVQIGKNTEKSAIKEQEVAYIIDGMNVKNFDYAKLCNASKAPSEINALRAHIDSLPDGHDKAVELADMLAACKRDESKLNYEVWKHRVCMYIKSGMKCVHEGQAGSWELDTKSRMKAIRYKCKDSGAEDLCVAVVNIDIGK